jgi:PAS domain S-box-containing protein
MPLAVTPGMAAQHADASGEVERDDPDKGSTSPVAPRAPRARAPTDREVPRLRDRRAADVADASDDAMADARRDDGLTFLADTSVRLLTHPRPEELIPDLIESLAAILPLDVAFNYLVREHSPAQLQLNASAGVDEDTHEMLAVRLVGQSVCGLVAQTGHPVVLSDVQASTDPTHALIRTLGLTDYACHPLRAEGELLGTLSFGRRGGRPFGERELTVLRAVSDQIALALHRQRLVTALRAEVEERRRTEADAAIFKVASEHSNDALLLIDPEGRICWANSLACERTGYAPNEITALRATDIAVGMSDEDFRELFERARRGRVAPFETLHRRRDGSTFPVEVTKTVVEMPDGPRMFSAVRDITERRRSEEALRRSEERYALAARASSNAIWDWDLATDQLSWNSGVRDVFGHSPEDVEGDLGWWVEHVHPDDRERVLAGLRRAIGGRLDDHVWRDEYRFRRVDGAYAIVVDRGYVSRDHDGRAVRMIGAMSDVTAERDAAAERERLLALAHEARREAEAANRAKSEFLAVMSHELRTPLNAIGGYAELIEMGIRGPVTPQQAEDLRRMQASQRHLLGLINEVLNYAKLETGAVRFDVSEVPVREVLLATEELVAPQARTKGLTLAVTECAPSLAVRTDADKLRQVLVNLLSNAIKFTDRGGRVTVGCDARGDVVHISVRDTGIGIAPDKLGAIFEPFVQVRSDLARTSEGTGLGLAISRDLARGMGGDLLVNSSPGTGSSFTIVLPRA